MKYLLLLLYICLFNVTQGSIQDTSMYSNYTIHMMNSSDETIQQIYAKILERTFSMGLSVGDSYDEINNQARCALTVVELYYIDEEDVDTENAGRYMLLYNSALLEGQRGVKDSTRNMFDKSYDWLRVLHSYVISSGIIRANIRLKKRFK